MKKLLFILIFSLVLTGCDKRESVFGGTDTIDLVSREINFTEYVTAPENNLYKIGIKNYESEFKDNISEEDSMKYKLNDRYFSLTPANIKYGDTVNNVKSVLKTTTETSEIFGGIAEIVENNKWEKVFNDNTNIEIKESVRKWQKVVEITKEDLVNSIKDDSEFVEIKFKFNTNFVIDGWDKKSDLNIIDKIRLGDFSYINQAVAWDSSSTEIIISKDETETLINKIKIKTVLSEYNNEFFITKFIPVNWLKDAVYPVYTDVDITYGTVVEFDNGEPRDINISKLEDDKFIMCYADYGSSADGVCIVGSVSGSTLSYGSQKVFDTDTISGSSPYVGDIDVIALSSSKFVVAYISDSLADDGYLRSATVSGTTISAWGTALKYAFGDSEYITIAKLDTDRAVTCYNYENFSDTGRCSAMTLSGTTITAGATTDFETNDNYPKQNTAVNIGTDKFVNCFFAEDYNSIRCVAATVSGTTITMGTVLFVDGNGYADRNYIDVVSYEDDKFVLAWGDDTAKRGYVAAMTVSGTTITEGTNYEFATTEQTPRMTMLDSSNFIITSHKDTSSTGGSGYSYLCSVDFSDLSIVVGSGESFEADDVTYFDVSEIGSNKIVICYQNNTDGRDLECIVGETAGEEPPITDTCTYSGTGAWNVNYSDNCYVTSDTYVSGDCNIMYDGAGSFNLQANLMCDELNVGAGASISAENSTAQIEIY